MKNIFFYITLIIIYLLLLIFFLIKIFYLYMNIIRNTKSKFINKVSEVHVELMVSNFIQLTVAIY